MPEPDYVRVYDRDLKRVYTAVRSAVEGIDNLDVIEGADPTDGYGNPAGPEFDVDRKPASKPNSGSAATPEKENKDA